MNWTRMTVFFAAAAFSCSLSACTGDKTPAGVGTWQGATFLSEDARRPLIGSDGNSNTNASWQDATLLSVNARHPVIGTDGNGNTIAVWQQSDGLYAACFDRNLDWKTTQKIVGRESEGDFLSQVHLAVNEKGDAIAAWVRSKYTRELIQTSRYTARSGWSAPQQLTPPNMVFNLDVALDSGSNAVIAWEGFNPPSGRNIVVSHSLHASGWAPPQTFGAAYRLAIYPKIAVDHAGNAFVLWLEGDYYSNNVYVNRYSPYIGWSSPQQIATNVGSAAWTNISFDKAGNAMAVWGQIDSSNHFHIYSCMYFAGSGWGISSVVDSNTLDSIEPSLAVDGSGNFRSVWVQHTETNKDIYSSRYAAHKGWDAPQLIGTGGNACSPRVDTDSFGNAFAAWSQYDPNDIYPGDANIYANSYTVKSGWGSQRQLKKAAGNADNPGLAVDSRDHATVIWSQSVGYSTPGVIKYGIFASRFQ